MWESQTVIDNYDLSQVVDDFNTCCFVIAHINHGQLHNFEHADTSTYTEILML